MLKKLLIFTVALIVLFFIFNNVIMPLYVKHSDTVKVPKITGMNYVEAKKILEDGGLEIKQGELKYDETIPIGQILDQNPPAEETVKYGRRVYVTVCGGEQLADVPNLRGRTLRDAKFTLEQRGLKLGETVRKNSTEFPEDYVLSQIIQPGSKLKRNSPIDLILSDGPLVGELKVPSVIGKTLDDAKKILTESKLKLGKITYQTNNELPPGQIIDQYPKVDKSANENTSIDLFVSRKKPVVKEEIEEADTGTETDLSNDKTKKADNSNDKPEIKRETPPDNKKETTTDKQQDSKKPDQDLKKNENPAQKKSDTKEIPKEQTDPKK